MSFWEGKSYNDGTGALLTHSVSLSMTLFIQVPFFWSFYDHLATFFNANWIFQVKPLISIVQ